MNNEINDYKDNYDWYTQKFVVKQLTNDLMNKLKPLKLDKSDINKIQDYYFKLIDTFNKFREKSFTDIEHKFDKLIRLEDKLPDHFPSKFLERLEIQLEESKFKFYDDQIYAEIDENS